MWGGMLPALLLATVVHVEGDTTCPRPEQVRSHLDQLLSAPAAAADSGSEDAGRARLTEENGELLVVLEDPSGEVIGTRRLPRSSACEDLASAVAVSIAVWMTDLHPSYSSAHLAPPPQPKVAAVELSVVATIPATPAWGIGLALGLGGSVDAPAAAADVAGSWWLRLRQSRTALRAEVEAQSRREMTLQGGKGQWRRWILGLGLERTLSGDGAGWLRGFAAARVALLELEGTGFAVNYRARVADPGASAGLRAVWTHGRWASWVEVAMSLWPIGHDVVADTGTNDVERLPLLEGFLRVGAGWGAGR